MFGDVEGNGLCVIGRLVFCLVVGDGVVFRVVMELLLILVDSEGGLSLEVEVWWELVDVGDGVWEIELLVVEVVVVVVGVVGVDVDGVGVGEVVGVVVMVFDGCDELLGRLEEVEVRICVDGDVVDVDVGVVDDSVLLWDVVVGWWWFGLDELNLEEDEEESVGGGEEGWWCCGFVLVEVELEVIVMVIVVLVMVRNVGCFSCEDRK